ncbi:GNAT family N-acetyltransferase [Exiguobacterium mexicanum]|uniref:GNAT family N-acetyltransferase n=1 Tax=Exiguobacterium mexicanum TaxID=340146 RepID=A0ABT7MLR1_9BACL|nr:MULTISPECIES: GNAT family N-acetyltransferase [Exiguobacterium]MDL5376188.1 GNAT family N-acetyltransferase [Exiguobacterium mexicanum]
MEEAPNISIKALDEYSISVVNEANNAFPVIGKIIPSFCDGVWMYEEQLYEKAHETSFPDDSLDWHEYINSEDKQVFLAFDETTCIGQIRVVKDWNRFAYIENIAVRGSYRNSGLGHLLIEAAQTWAKKQSLLGLSLEAQNDNVIACRFYVKEGFALGGVDTLKQTGNPNIDMTLYWYKIF